MPLFKKKLPPPPPPPPPEPKQAIIKRVEHTSWQGYPTAVIVFQDNRDVYYAVRGIQPVCNSEFARLLRDGDEVEYTVYPDQPFFIKTLTILGLFD